MKRTAVPVCAILIAGCTYSSPDKSPVITTSVREGPTPPPTSSTGAAAPTPPPAPGAPTPRPTAPIPKPSPTRTPSVSIAAPQPTPLPEVEAPIPQPDSEPQSTVTTFGTTDIVTTVYEIGATIRGSTNERFLYQIVLGCCLTLEEIAQAQKDGLANLGSKPKFFTLNSKAMAMTCLRDAAQFKAESLSNAYKRRSNIVEMYLKQAHDHALRARDYESRDM